MAAQNIVLIVHYFPPLNSSGAKRMEAMAKYFVRDGRSVTVLTSRKTAADGVFSEEIPAGVRVIELDGWGRAHAAGALATKETSQRIVAAAAANRGLKAAVMNILGQLPDPRLVLAFSFLSPALAKEVKAVLRDADVIVASCPPWPTLLAGLFAKWRSRKAKLVLDYRDQFSRCHEMPGTRAAKAMEEWIDRSLARRADAVVAVSEPMAAYYSTFGVRVDTILNGYDPEKLATAQDAAPWRPRADGAPLTIRYLGLVTPGRVPVHILGALERLRGEGKIRDGSLLFEYYGDAAVMRDAVETRYPALAQFFRFYAPVAYGKALELIVSADHVLMCENAVAALAGEEKSAAGIMTTKLFEYIASARPILADISSKTLVGSVMVQASPDHFVAETEDAFASYMTTDKFWQPHPVVASEVVRSFSREAQAGQYLGVIDRLGA